MSKKPLTTAQFFRQFPDDETCLNHLFEVRFGQGFECPSCERPSNWYRIKAERAYSCQWCGHHLHPTVGTPFEQTRTPLQLWFYAMHLFTTTRHGVSGKELERQLGVTYKTAWRMAKLIREHMADVDGSDPIGGVGEIVEIDETIVGGSVSGKGSGYMGNKSVVVGMVERGGNMITRVVSTRTRGPTEALIQANILPGTTISTDEFGSYRFLNTLGYQHMTVSHKTGRHVGLGGASTNAIEGFWRHLKCSIAGTHISVSPKYMDRYVGEFEFRFNRRNDPASMFPALVSTFRPSTAKRG